MLARPKAAAIELRHVLPAAVLAQIELETLALVSSSYPRPSRGPLDSDLLFEAMLRGPDERRSVRFMIDHQSTPDVLFPFRTHVYAGAYWGRYVDAQPRRPRRLPFVIPVLLAQYPARNTPTRLSDVLDLPEHLREAFGAPFETRIYVDDLRRSVLDDPVADPGHLALVEVARTLLYTYENPHALDDPRLGTLGPLFDVVLDCFGPGEIEEIMSYVVSSQGEGSPILAMIVDTLSRAVKEVFVTMADKLRAEGRSEGLKKGRSEGLDQGLAKGRARATAEMLLRMLGHRGWPVPASLRARVLATTDERRLQQWFDRALVATSLEEVFRPLDT